MYNFESQIYIKLISNGSYIHLFRLQDSFVVHAWFRCPDSLFLFTFLSTLFIMNVVLTTATWNLGKVSHICLRTTHEVLNSGSTRPLVSDWNLHLFHISFIRKMKKNIFRIQLDKIAHLYINYPRKVRR